MSLGPCSAKLCLLDAVSFIISICAAFTLNIFGGTRTTIMVSISPGGKIMEGTVFKAESTFMVVRAFLNRIKMVISSLR